MKVTQSLFSILVLSVALFFCGSAAQAQTWQKNTVHTMPAAHAPQQVLSTTTAKSIMLQTRSGVSRSLGTKQQPLLEAAAVLGRIIIIDLVLASIIGGSNIAAAMIGQGQVGAGITGTVFFGLHTLLAGIGLVSGGADTLAMLGITAVSGAMLALSIWNIQHGSRSRSHHYSAKTSQPGMQKAHAVQPTALVKTQF